MTATGDALVFTPTDAWARIPADVLHGDVAAVGVDDVADRVYLFTRDVHRVLVLDRTGEYLGSWGEGLFTMPHGLTVAPDGSVWLVDCGDHTARRFGPDGELIQTLGTAGVATDTGYAPRGRPHAVHAVETVCRPAGPFNACTNLAVGPEGDVYVADGYGNCRVHRFRPDGTLVRSWGEVGEGPGEFRLPHGICTTPDGRVLVGDRENDRIQVFDGEGELLAIWTGVQRPTDLAVDADGLVYVSELWRPVGTATFVAPADDVDRPGRVTVLSPDGAVVARWGTAGGDRGAVGAFVAPHGITVDARGDVYVAEVTGSYGIKPGRVAPDLAGHQLQKFVRSGR